jgi:hypothetical protein
MSYEHNHDRIVYALYERERLVAAHYDKGEALAQIQRAKVELTMKPEVVDVSARRQAILESFNPLDRLIMDPPKPDQKRRGG